MRNREYITSMYLARHEVSASERAIFHLPKKSRPALFFCLPRAGQGVR
jgi:hypothetical protein